MRKHIRKTIAITLVALAAAACSSDSTGPANTDLTALDAGAFGTALITAGGYDAETYQNRLVNGLPDEIALSDAQKAQIKSLVQAFIQSTRSDRDSLTAILREAHEAARAGKSREEVNSILAKGAPIRDRLSAAEAKLKSDIDAVLTPEQRAWIAAHTPKACRADQFPPLTDEQKAQIKTLETAFQAAHQADIDAVKSILADAQAAIRAGKSHDEIAAILAKAVAPLQRLATARLELRNQILAVLTPEQKASGCLPLG